jgi:diguanylate cyclase (GGDEF)-like protein
MLFITPIDQSKFFELISAYIVVILTVSIISDLIAQVIINADKKVFELRRLSENMNMTNEALRSQQEKVKRANEELGIQKIKLETAYDKINNVNAETTIQNLIMKYISSSLEITTLLDLITESVLEAIGLDFCAILIQPGIAGNEEILYRIRTRLNEESKNLLSRKIAHGCLEKYINKDGTYIDNRVEEEKYTFLSKGDVGSLLIVPLVREQNVIGALICGKSQYNFFHDNIPFFETVVSQLLVAIHNASLFTKLQQMAIRDSLTGIYNRGQLNLMVDQYSKDAIEKKIPLSIALFDIDHFKKINDTYGHLFGDEVIKEIARYAQEVATKHHGIAARYGGEEFVMVFQNKDIDQCKEIVEELRLRIEEIQIPYEGDIVTTEISVGLASYPETCHHIRELLNRADGAMYYSKKEGRNKVTIDNDEVQEAIKKEKVI